MRTPANSIFGTHELLERVLIHLPIRDLFVLQRISTKFSVVVQRFHLIRERMFLRADGDVLRPNPNHQNPDIDELSPGCEVVMRLNPAAGLFRNGLHHNACVSPECGRQHWANYEFSVLPGYVNICIEIMPVYQSGHPDCIPIGYYAPEASWRKIFATQPPVTAVIFLDLDLDEAVYYCSRGHVLTVRNPEGITFGESYDWWLLYRREHEEKPGEAYDSRWSCMQICVTRPQDKEVESAFCMCNSMDDDGDMCDSLLALQR